MVRRLNTLLCLGLAALLFGCGGGGSGGDVPDPTLRFVNASPDSVALNLLVDDDQRASSVPYLGSSPTFARIDDRERDLRLFQNGNGEELTNEVFTFGPDRHYVTAAVGLVNFGSEPLKRLRASTFEVDRTPPNGNKSRLYVLHAYQRSAGFDTPNIDFQSPGDNPVARVTDIAFGAQKSLLVDSGTQTFEARRGGTENVLHSATAALGAGKIYVVVVGGIEDAAGAQAPSMTFIELQPE